MSWRDDNNRRANERAAVGSGRVAEVRRGFKREYAYVRAQEEPTLPPPRPSWGLFGWARDNLFSSIGNSVLTILGIAIIVTILPPIIQWAFIDAVWTGESGEACRGTGACWAFVAARIELFLFGSYPIDERWRPDLAGLLLIIGVIWIAVPRIPYKRASAIFLFVAFPIIALILLTGGDFDIGFSAVLDVVIVGALITAVIASLSGRERSPLLAGIIAPAALVIAVFLGVVPIALALAGVELGSIAGPIFWIAVSILAVALVASLLASLQNGALIRSFISVWLLVAAVCVLLGIFAIDWGMEHVETERWGGLLVTLVVALTGMGASMPLGIALALGRRSQMPVVRFVCITFIEFVRGVPLITILFMASVMIPLFTPEGVNFDKLVRALIGVALFEAAYMAEVVRGGLQSIPKGQYEAAMALGLNYWNRMRLIILPQALKTSIPGIVNSFISLFKDTSLVGIIGIFDLLEIIRASLQDSEWRTSSVVMTGYVFAGLVFWAFCFGMSRYSLYMERRLDTGYRR